MSSVARLGVYDFTIRKGDTLRIPFVFGGAGFDPTDITGWDAEIIISDFETPSSVLLTATTGNSKILIDGPNLTATLVLADTETDGLTWERGKYTLKLIDTPGTGDHATYVKGTACVVDDC